jgi:hypothetical protein
VFSSVLVLASRHGLETRTFRDVLYIDNDKLALVDPKPRVTGSCHVLELSPIRHLSSHILFLSSNAYSGQFRLGQFFVVRSESKAHRGGQPDPEKSEA